MSKKNTYYFQHDSNAREDDKIVALRMKHGSAGYGVYFMLLEILATSDGFQYKRDYNKLGYVLHEQAGLIKQVVEGFELFQFTDDGERFYSTRLTQHMEALTDLSSKRSEAGRLGNEKRWNRKPIANQSQSDSKAIANQSQVIAYNIREDNIREKESETRAREESEDKKNSAEVMSLKKIYEEYRAEIAGDTIKAENAERFARMPRAKIAEYLDQFQAKLITEGATHKSRGDYQRHFTSWLKIQIDKLAKQPPSQATDTRLHPKPITGGYSTDF